ncbi:MAG: DUF1841 family protein [Pseudomonadota bacterium]
MLEQNRDQTRQVFFSVWQKVLKGLPMESMELIIADIIKRHPEYHSMLDEQEKSMANDFSIEQGETNPFLHMGLHIAIREQIAADRPIGINQLYKELIKQYNSEHDVEHAMIDCLAESLWLAQQQQSMPDELQYMENLRQLKKS